MGVADSATLHHTCFVVRDLDATAKALASSLGVSWNVWTLEPPSATLHGRSVRFSFKAALAQVGNAVYELIEPVAGDSVYVEHLATRGEGFHHTCLVYETREALRHAKAELERQGRELIQGGGDGDAYEFCYFSVPEMGGALELLFLGGALPPPDQTIG